MEFLGRAQVVRCSRGSFSHYGRFAVSFCSSPGHPSELAPSGSWAVPSAVNAGLTPSTASTPFSLK